MAHCPKCGKKLHIYNWKQTCPHCNVNLVYYKANEKLLEESEAAEIEHALFQPKIDRAKASTIGSPITWVRLVLSVLVLVVLILVPLAKVSFTGPFMGQTNENISINGIKLVDVLSNLDTGYLTTMLGDPMFKTAAICYAVSIVSIALTAVMIIVCLVCLVMSLGKHGLKRNVILNCFSLLLICVSGVTFKIFADSMHSVFPDFTGKLSWGIFAYAAVWIILLILHIIIGVKGVEVKHMPCLIGGLPSEEYFKMKEDGVSEIEIRKKMIEALTKMEKEILEREAAEKEKAEQERSKWK